MANTNRSAFDNTGMIHFIEKYKPSTIYDPCSGWGRLIINRSYYGGLNKKYERLMFNQKEDVLPILLAYFNAFTKDDINNDTPYEVKQSLYNNKLIYVLIS